MGKPDIHLMREWGLICEDPDCEATHTDIDDLPDTGIFVEDINGLS